MTSEATKESAAVKPIKTQISRPLFTYFPDLKSVVPVQHKALLPTAVETLPFSQQAWIKRDDLSHSEYGGNKIRKLEFIIADAKKQGATGIVTFGAIGTNHGVATAMMCRQANMSCTVYLFDQPLTDTVKKNLRLMQYYGAELIYKGSLFKTVLAYYLSPLRLQSGNYFLFAGGSNLYGTLAFVNAACELKQQIDGGELPLPRVIVCPVGSSATLAGLTYGCQLIGLQTKIMGVRVAPEKLGPFPACTPATVYALMNDVYKFMQTHLNKPVAKPEPAWLDNSYYGGGYGVATSQGQQAVETFKAHGIALEQTYTAKAAAAFLDQLEQQNGPVLFWDTYNSRDMTQQAASVPATDLPPPLQKFLQ